METAKDKLIVALDVDSSKCALELFEMLRDAAGMFKIGSQLFTAAGPDIVRRIIANGGRVFLDLKFHDIPNTVAAAAVAATRLGVSIFNVHASGGVEMMKRTAEAVKNTAAQEALPPPKVLAVTVLTSLNKNNLEQIGYAEDLETVVLRLAQLAADCGLDGIVASPREIETVRGGISNANFLIVTPGIRLLSSGDDDQKRIMTAAEAIIAGADYIVVGRPILNAPDPLQAAHLVVQEIAKAPASLTPK